MKVYVLISHEPLETRVEALDAGEPPLIYATREIAEIAAKEYNDENNDPQPATVVEIDVKETPSLCAYA
jgi:hypothetical protein